MIFTSPMLDMLGDELRDAVAAAHERLSDDTIGACCAESLWSVVRADDVLAEGLTYEAAVAAIEALA